LRPQAWQVSNLVEWWRVWCLIAVDWYGQQEALLFPALAKAVPDASEAILNLQQQQYEVLEQADVVAGSLAALLAAVNAQSNPAAVAAAVVAVAATSGGAAVTPSGDSAANTPAAPLLLQSCSAAAAAVGSAAHYAEPAQLTDSGAPGNSRTAPSLSTSPASGASPVPPQAAPAALSTAATQLLREVRQLAASGVATLVREAALFEEDNLMPQWRALPMAFRSPLEARIAHGRGLSQRGLTLPWLTASLPDPEFDAYAASLGGGYFGSSRQLTAAWRPRWHLRVMPLLVSVYDSTVRSPHTLPPPPRCLCFCASGGDAAMVAAAAAAAAAGCSVEASSGPALGAVWGFGRDAAWVSRAMAEEDGRHAVASTRFGGSGGGSEAAPATASARGAATPSLVAVGSAAAAGGASAREAAAAGLPLLPSAAASASSVLQSAVPANTATPTPAARAAVAIK
jgi:hypothetical protein